MQCSAEYIEQCKNIKVDSKNRIFIQLGQSETLSWLSEWFFRIIYSSEAHEIKRRKKNREKSACCLINEKSTVRSKKEDIIYRLVMESSARSCFESKTSLTVIEIGLVVFIKQPFLACTPDG